MTQLPKATPKTQRRNAQKRGRTSDPKVLAAIRELLGDAPRRRDLLIEFLHRIQDHYGYLGTDHLVALAEELKLSGAEVYEVATFYHHFDVVADGAAPPPPLTVRVCESISCMLAGAEDLIAALERGLGDGIRVQRVPCVGRCDCAPVAVVGLNPIGHADATAVIAKANANDRAAPPTRHLGYDGYRAAGGYQLWLDCLAGKRNVDEIIKTIEDAQLRGLGGAGFPSGRKWRVLREQPKPRLIAVNIDEGEPGTFKDRHYLERDPHRFLEGMLIAAWAIEAEACYIYLRDEYASCRATLAAELDLLRRNAPAPLPRIELRRGAGAYVCGEESAMIESIEGKRGMPRLRPPFVAEVGLFGRPTLEHNMETLHWIREVVERGADWFASQGRHGRKGLRSFSVSGRVKKPGVHLAPAGITLNELIAEYCGGMQDGHTLYGYLPGGASGGMLPARLADVPLDFGTLQEHGCFIGSAAVMVFSEHDSARAIARNAMHFFEHESCGKCTPCRVGTAKASRLMAEDQWDTKLLGDLARVMEDASICGLGQAAPNPLRTALKYFPEEFK